VVFNTGLCTDLPDNSILITANMQSETGFPSSHQLKSYVAFKSRLKLAARAVLSADAGLLVETTDVNRFPRVHTFKNGPKQPKIWYSIGTCMLFVIELQLKRHNCGRWKLFQGLVDIPWMCLLYVSFGRGRTKSQNFGDLTT